MYTATTHQMKKYKIQTMYNYQWFDYKPNMDIVQALNSNDDLNWKTYTPVDLCPAVKCYINSGFDDGTLSDTSYTTCNSMNSNINTKLVWE
jgi:hypothetical protein